MLFKNEKELIENGRTQLLQDKRKDALTILAASVESINPYSVISSRLTEKSIQLDHEQLNLDLFQNIFLVGFGKASVGMAQAVCDTLTVKKGVVITNDPTGKVTHPAFQSIHGGHPIPNENSIQGTQEIEDVIAGCSSEDLLIIVISGGGSALLCHPKVPLEDMQQTTRLLLKSGATITEINTVRKHVSYVKGGNLVKNVACRVVAFIISDVVDDPLEFIASGPTCGDDTTYQDAISILKKYQIWNVTPQSVIHVLTDGANGLIPETPSRDDDIFMKVDNIIVANNTLACETAFQKAKELGYKPILLSTSIVGEARDVGKELVYKSNQLVREKGINLCIAGGETTVTIHGDGKGGRNQEMVLSVVELLADTKQVFVSFATDGIDGMSPGAGAIADGETFQRAKSYHLHPQTYLQNNDSYSFFKKLNDVLLTGPTGTNVMDLQIIL